MVPTRSTLLVASARDEAALAHLLTVAANALDVDDRWLSTSLHRLDDQTWHAFEPPPALHAAHRMLMLRNQSHVYQSQKTVLERLFQAQGVDCFVASFKVWRHPDGTLASEATWTEGVEALLPVVEQINFVLHEGPHRVIARLPWTTVQRAFGEYLETTSYLPTRVRVKGWPGTAEIQREAKGDLS
jgi:hypothetical protein